MDMFRQALERNPVIAAVKSRKMLEKAVCSPAEILFLLSGNICELREIVSMVQEKGKQLYIHIDLLDGIGHDSYALKFLAQYAKPDGVISTKTSLIKSAQECGLKTVQRVFMLDSMSLGTGLELLEHNSLSRTH